MVILGVILFYICICAIFAGIFAAFSFVTISLFAMDKLVLFIATWYYTHHYFSVKVSSGYAVYFWDLLAAVLVVIIYMILFQIIYVKFNLLGKVLDLAISFFSSMTVYCLLANSFISGGKSYFVPLLNNSFMNEVVNYIIIGLISLLVWKKRETFLLEIIA